eukprot:TRINITY_DN44493_c0_g1_i1.p1 TRINITY_DN44493_c0_g1~~TRINITY_DN44493_c0_g1_i1.p1  ORF type:complete len:443 (-),score=50.66 TRINITY_DN44493_c0_g1_i1:12-1340(-)
MLSFRVSNASAWNVVGIVGSHWRAYLLDAEGVAVRRTRPEVGHEHYRLDDDDPTIDLVLVYCIVLTTVCCMIVAYLFLRVGDAEVRLKDRRETNSRVSLVSYCACVLAALALGSLVCWQSKVFVDLNRNSEQPLLHAITLTFIVHALAVVPLLVLSFADATPWSSPPPWAWFSGACTALSYMQVVSNSSVGLAITLTALISGNLTAALLIDFWKARHWGLARLLGICLVLAGAVILLFDLESVGLSCSPDTAFDLLSLGLTAVAGAGYSCQALCAQHLTSSLGSVSRSALVSILGGTLCFLPPALFLGESLAFKQQDFPSFVFCVSIYIIYIVAMAKLPSVISFSTSFSMKVCGQMLTAVVIDAAADGQLGTERKMSACRISGILCAVCGTIVVQYFGFPSEEDIDAKGVGKTFVSFGEGYGVLQVKNTSKSLMNGCDSDSD